MLPLVLGLAASGVSCGSEPDDASDWVGSVVLSPAGNTYQLTLTEETLPASRVLEPGYSSFTMDPVELLVENLNDDRASNDLIIETYLFFDCGLLSEEPSAITPAGSLITSKTSWAEADGGIVSPDGYCVQTLTPVTVGPVDPGHTARLSVGRDDFGFVVPEAQTGRLITMMATPVIVQFGLREGSVGTSAADGPWFYSPRLSVTEPSLNSAPSQADNGVETASATSLPPSVPTTGDSTTVPTTPGVVGSSTPTSSECPTAESAAERRRVFTAAPPICIEAAAAYHALITTNLGDMLVTLDSVNSPLTVNSFVYLARYGYFDDTICHRVEKDFVTQCGDPQGTGKGGPGYTLPDEPPASGSYAVGTVGMANAGPNTTGSQFFFVTGEKGTALPANYSLLGTLVSGLGTLSAMDALANPDTSAGVAPTSEIRILSIKIISVA